MNYKNNVHTASAVLAYIPLIGWIVPLYRRKGDSLCQHHAKQGFLLSILFVTVTILLNISNLFIPKEMRDVSIAIIITIYVVYLLYLILCLAGAIASYRGMEFNVPFIRMFSNLIEL